MINFKGEKIRALSTIINSFDDLPEIILRIDQCMIGLNMKDMTNTLKM